MKKLLLTAVAAFSMQLAFAQKSAVTNASLYLKNGTLDKAKTEIDKAVTNEKTANDPKAWFTKGEIYAGMVNNPIYAKLATDPLTEAMAAYDKAIALDKPNGEFAKQAQEKKNAMGEVVYVSALNEGVKNYQEQKFKEAYDAFTKAQQARPQDTTAYLYAATSAEQSQNFAGAKENYRKLIGINYTKPNVYNRLYYIAKEVDKNEAEAMKVLEEGLKANPNNKELMLEELNMYISSGKSTEAVSKLENAIKVDPKNVNLYLVLGQVYEQTKDYTKAEANYKKALEIEPTNANANFNLGVVHFNRGYEINKKLRGLSSANYAKQAPKLEPEMKKHFNTALPFFEASLKANPNDTNTMDTLAKVYLALGRTKDADAMNKRADAVKKK
jgi:tetratricopeptide (TPR) repeat protein